MFWSVWVYVVREHHGGERTVGFCGLALSFSFLGCGCKLAATWLCADSSPPRCKCIRAGGWCADVFLVYSWSCIKMSNRKGVLTNGVVDILMGGLPSVHPREASHIPRTTHQRHPDKRAHERFHWCRFRPGAGPTIVLCDVANTRRKLSSPAVLPLCLLKQFLC